MTRKIELPNPDYWINRYLAGESVDKLAGEAGVKSGVLRRVLKEANVKPRGSRMDIPDLDTIIARYIAGETEQSLALEFNLARTVMRRRLLEAGIKPRTISDTMLTRWANVTPEQREAMLGPAHKAVTGRPQTIEFLQRCALGRERTKKAATPVETTLANWLRDYGLNITQQKAIGIYNIDVAVNEPPVAIEIFGGNFHSSGRHAARFHERYKYILDSGWSVLIIWIDAKRYPLTIYCANQAFNLCEHIGPLPSNSREYWVIRGDGYFLTASEKYFNSPADKERLGCR